MTQNPLAHAAAFLFRQYISPFSHLHRPAHEKKKNDQVAIRISITSFLFRNVIYVLFIAAFSIHTIYL
jgi:hypothetical protein